MVALCLLQRFCRHHLESIGFLFGIGENFPDKNLFDVDDNLNSNTLITEAVGTYWGVLWSVGWMSIMAPFEFNKLADYTIIKEECPYSSRKDDSL